MAIAYTSLSLSLSLSRLHRCDIQTVHVSELGTNGEFFARDFVSLRKPVRIRGAMDRCAFEWVCVYVNFSLSLFLFLSISRSVSVAVSQCVRLCVCLLYVFRYVFRCFCVRLFSMYVKMSLFFFFFFFWGGGWWWWGWSRWNAVHHWSKKAILALYGNLTVQYGAIPYGEEFGTGRARKTIKEFIEYMDGEGKEIKMGYA